MRLPSTCFVSFLSLICFFVPLSSVWGENANRIIVKEQNKVPEETALLVAIESVERVEQFYIADFKKEDFVQVEEFIVSHIKEGGSCRSFSIVVVGDIQKKDMEAFLSAAVADLIEKNTYFSNCATKVEEEKEILFDPDLKIPRLVLGIKRPPINIHSGDEIKRLTAELIIQEMLKTRLEALVETKKTLFTSCYQTNTWLPNHLLLSVDGQTKEDLDQYEAILQEFTQICEKGFNGSEFLLAKEKTKSFLANKQADLVSNYLPMLAYYFYESTQTIDIPVDLAACLHTSIQYVDVLSEEDISFYLDSFFEEMDIHVVFVCPPSLADTLSEEDLEKPIETRYLLENRPSPLKIKQVPLQLFSHKFHPSSDPKPPETPPPSAVINDEDIDYFNQLSITDTDKRNIRKIITSMAEKNVFELLLEKNSLEKKGKEIRHVHPLRFLGYIGSDSYLKKCLYTISKNHFKWDNFVEGFEDKMKEENKKEQLLPYVDGFSKTLSIDANKIRDLVNRSDYIGIIKAVM